ncbi:hypothetical protein CEXT_161011 [Caerostris extrusa]|uniref:Uncharacterized protein n=1 Tax=Caerostris extrusa TaxID=172846 RepID=A0AAV4W6W4_CAEEX|nr:hypothetical protein CEXT_161011 [Caerostris extrusa]
MYSSFQWMYERKPSIYCIVSISLGKKGSLGNSGSKAMSAKNHPLRERAETQYFSTICMSLFRIMWGGRYRVGSSKKGGMTGRKQNRERKRGRRQREEEEKFG